MDMPSAMPRDGKKGRAQAGEVQRVDRDGAQADDLEEEAGHAAPTY